MDSQEFRPPPAKKLRERQKEALQFILEAKHEYLVAHGKPPPDETMVDLSKLGEVTLKKRRFEVLGMTLHVEGEALQ